MNARARGKTARPSETRNAQSASAPIAITAMKELWPYQAVNSVVSSAALSTVVAALLAKPPEALRGTRGLLRHGRREEILERMKLESSMFAERLASPEVKEAISAFFEKRRPQ